MFKKIWNLIKKIIRVKASAECKGRIEIETPMDDKPNVIEGEIKLGTK